ALSPRLIASFSEIVIIWSVAFSVTTLPLNGFCAEDSEVEICAGIDIDEAEAPELCAAAEAAAGADGGPIWPQVATEKAISTAGMRWEALNTCKIEPHRFMRPPEILGIGSR